MNSTTRIVSLVLLSIVAGCGGTSGTAQDGGLADAQATADALARDLSIVDANQGDGIVDSAVVDAAFLDGAMVSDLGCTLPANSRVMFVLTGVNHAGSGGALNGGDCSTAGQQHANLCGRPFIPFFGRMSGGVTANPYNDGRDIILPSGTLIANASSFWTTPQSPHAHAIDEEADGTQVSGDISCVWTGFNSVGSIGSTCSDWTSSASSDVGHTGSWASSDGNWCDNNASRSCAENCFVYCIEE